jgi:hypothetical protein
MDHDPERSGGAPPLPAGRSWGPAGWARSSAALAVAVSITLGLLAAVVVAIAHGGRGTTDDPPPVIATGRPEATGRRTLTAEDVAGPVAVELGLDRVQVDCQGDLVIAKGESVPCFLPFAPGALAQVDVRVADVVDGQPVLEFFDQTGLHVTVLGEPLTEDETQWLRTLRELQGQQRELLYPDAAGIDAQTLREWSSNAARCTAELGPAGPPSARLAEAGRRAASACDELDLAATAFAAAAARADSTDEHDIRVRVERVRTAVARWEWGNYLLEEAWRVARQTAPGVGAG